MRPKALIPLLVLLTTALALAPSSAQERAPRERLPAPDLSAREPLAVQVLRTEMKAATQDLRDRKRSAGQKVSIPASNLRTLHQPAMSSIRNIRAQIAELEKTDATAADLLRAAVDLAETYLAATALAPGDPVRDVDKTLEPPEKPKEPPL